MFAFLIILCCVVYIVVGSFTAALTNKMWDCRPSSFDFLVAIMWPVFLAAVGPNALAEFFYRRVLGGKH